MKAVNIEDVLNQRRFKPFDLFLDNGRSLRIKHPECLMLNESKTTAVVADGDHLHIVDLDHVSNVSFATRKQATGAP